MTPRFDTLDGMRRFLPHLAPVLVVVATTLLTVVLSECIPAADAVATPRADRPCVEALTDRQGQVLAGPELERLRALYATFGLAHFLDFDYAIQGPGARARIVWLSRETLIAVWASRMDFDGYIRLPHVGANAYALAAAPSGVPLRIYPQATDGWTACIASHIVR